MMFAKPMSINGLALSNRIDINNKMFTMLLLYHKCLIGSLEMLIDLLEIQSILPQWLSLAFDEAPSLGGRVE